MPEITLIEPRSKEMLDYGAVVVYRENNYGNPKATGIRISTRNPNFDNSVFPLKYHIKDAVGTDLMDQMDNYAILEDEESTEIAHIKGFESGLPKVVSFSRVRDSVQFSIPIGGLVIPITEDLTRQPAQREHRFSYDPDGNLLKIENYAIQDVLDIKTGVSTHYEAKCGQIDYRYDSLGRIVEIREGIGQESVNLIKYEYKNTDNCLVQYQYSYSIKLDVGGEKLLGLSNVSAYTISNYERKYITEYINPDLDKISKLNAVRYEYDTTKSMQEKVLYIHDPVLAHFLHNVLPFFQ